MPRRSVAAAVLAAAILLPATPASASAQVDGLPAGEWPVCADAAADYCVETITAEGDWLDGVGPVLSVTTTSEGGVPAVRWSVSGWLVYASPRSARSAALESARAGSQVSPGEVRLVIRTGSLTPRITTAVADGLAVGRTVDGAGRHTLTLSGRPAYVSRFSQGALAESCTARIFCGDEDGKEEFWGTLPVFEGQALDAGPGVLDGAFLFTGAQAYTRQLTFDPVDGSVGLGVLGGPQLTYFGNATRHRLGVWLPPGYFAAIGVPVADALATGFDVVGGGVGLAVRAVASGDGVLVTVPTVAFGAALTGLRLFPRASTARPGQGLPGEPRWVRAVADGAGGARVTWEAPRSDGGRPVLGYRARAYTWPWKLAGSCRTTTSPSCVIAGLGGADEVLVSAFTVLGESDPWVAEVEPPELSAPRAVKLVAGAGRITAGWAAPSFDGGSPVGEYEVHAYRSAGDHVAQASCVAPAARRTCVLTGLVNARYYVSVRAFTAAGAGPESYRASAVPFTVASAPRSVAATSARSRVTVSWAAPVSNGGAAVTGYRAEVWTAARGGSLAARCVTTARSCGTGVLTNGRTYYVTVLALNAAGYSPGPARTRVVVRR